MPGRRPRAGTILTCFVAGAMLLAGGGNQGLADAPFDPEAAILTTFAQINAIPRCSKDEGRISAWLVAWARRRGLAASRDVHDNVLITVAATPGWEERPGVVLQAHMDMVCVKTEASTHDFTRDAIPLIRDGDWVRASDTSLGADAGIGMALALTVAEKAGQPRPRLEILFTTDEEQHMTGAAGLSPALLTGQRYINLDSDDDAVVTLGAAGGLHTELHLPLMMTPRPAGTEIFTLTVSGLRGGHSGLDIGKNRANANVLAARALVASVPFRLMAFSGGSAGNAIAARAEVTVALTVPEADALRTHLSAFVAETRAAFPDEPGLAITLTPATKALASAASAPDSAAAMKLIASIPQGVTAWSQAFPGLPGTSNNIGVVQSSDDGLTITTFQRSFQSDALVALAGQIVATAHAVGASSLQSGAFPAWPPNPNSTLAKAVAVASARLFGTTMKSDVVHAGLECGHIASKYPSMDIVSLGPTVENPHTPHERLKLPSVVKTWTLLLEVLQSP